MNKIINGSRALTFWCNLQSLPSARDGPIAVDKLVMSGMVLSRLLEVVPDLLKP